MSSSRKAGALRRPARIALILTALAAVLGAQPTQGPSLTKEVAFRPADLKILSDPAGARYVLPGTVPATIAGEPEVPVLPVSIDIPAGSRVVGYDVEVRAEESLSPGRPPRAASSDPYEAGVPDVGLYKVDRPFPAERLVFTGVGRSAERHLAQFVYFPVRVNPVSGEVLFATRAVLRVWLEGSDGAEGTPQKRTAEELDAARAEDATRGFAPTDAPSKLGSAVDYVIVCPDEFASAMQPLADWKTRRGTRAVVRTLSWIQERYPHGVDLAEKIRQFLTDAEALWGTRWAVLAGDTGQIPIRYAYIRFYATPGAFIATDLYYYGLDGNWNGDGDNLFGEGPQIVGGTNPGDDADILPDIYGGRLPIGDVAGAQTIVSKILQYETAPQVNDVDRALFFAEVLFPPNWRPGLSISVDGADLADSTIYYLPASIHVARLYENYYDHPGSYPETKDAVIDSMNAGYGILHHIGHGFRNTMSVGSGSLSNEDVEALSNGPRFSVLYALNCSSAAVDYNCIAEEFLLNPNGGTVAAIGATDLDFPSTSFPYMIEFYRLLFQEGLTRIGEAFVGANLPFAPIAEIRDNADRWMQFAQILLGDPEMDVWTGAPRTMTASYPTSFPLGSTSFQITVTSSGAPVPGAQVCLHKPNDVYVLGATNTSGIATLSASPDSLGIMYVTVSKHDYVPLRGQTNVTAAPSSTPVLVVQSLAVSDAAGNNDGIVNPGEQVNLTVTVANRGTATTAGGITATLAGQSAGVNVLQGSGSLSALGAGTSGSAAPAFQISLSDTLSDEEEVWVDVAMASGAGTWSQRMFLPVLAPQLDIFEMAIKDTIGTANRNGALEPGESGYVSLSLTNLGRGAALNLVAKLRPGTGGASVPDSTASLAALAAGGLGAMSPSFRVIAAPDSVPLVSLVLNDAYGQILERTVDLVPPAATDSVWTQSDPSTITLNWNPSGDTDTAGYHVYRSQSAAGPFERITDGLIRMAYYKDERFGGGSLPGLTRFYYQVASVDSSGHHGPASTVISATTTAPLLAGWPVQTNALVKATGAAIEDLNSNSTIDNSLEIVVGSGNLFVMESDGREYVDGDGIAVTLGVFSSRGRGIWSTPAIADLDHDHDKEIVVQSWGEFDTAGDESLFVYDGAWAKPKANWPRRIVNGNWGSPAIGNIDADANLEVVAIAGGNVYAWNSNGTPVTSDPFYAIPNGTSHYGSPALADIDGDGREDIIFGERRAGSNPTANNLRVFRGDGIEVTGFPQPIGYYSTSSPAVADLDGSVDLFRPEIIIATADSVFIFDHDGTPRIGGPPPVLGYNYGNFTDLMSSPAVGDLDLNDTLDVVIGTKEGWVYAWRGRDGVALHGWPVKLTKAVLSSPVIANLDSDSELEVLIADQNGYVHGLNHDGTLLEGWPYKTGNGVFGSPLIWDVDGNGTTNVVIVSFDQYVYVLDLPEVPFDPLDVQNHPWPKFRHDSRNSGAFPTSMFVPVALSSLAGAHAGGGLVNLSWEATADYVTFHVYRSEDGGAELLAGTVAGRQGDGYLPYDFADEDVPDGSYLYIIGGVPRSGGAEERFGPIRVEVSASGVPVVAELMQNWPNPFNPETTIRYRVPASLGKERLSLRVYDIGGRLVRVLADRTHEPGGHAATWDGRGEDGRPVASGIYVYRLEGPGVSIARKMSLIQ